MINLSKNKSQERQTLSQLKNNQELLINIKKISKIYNLISWINNFKTFQKK
jgi:hypothetical protein